MSTRNLRSNSRNPVNSDNLAENTTTAITTTPSNTVPLVTTSAITPLMSISFPTGQGPQTHSSPDTDQSITTPTYSSLTARAISGQGSETVRRNIVQMEPQNRDSQPDNVDRAENEDEQTLREYVCASVAASQAVMRRELQNMQLMLPQLIRESLQSSENRNLQDQRSYVPNQTNQSFDNNFGRPQRQPYLPNQPRMSHPTRPYHHNIPQPVFDNSHDSQQFPGFNTAYPNNGYNSMNPNQIEKWGIKYDGSNKTLTVEDFIFRVESLRQDYNCSWEVVMKGFHHLVTGTASTWFWSFRMKHPICDWYTFKHHMIKKFRNFENDYEIQRRIMERRQASNESADTFISEIVRLKNQLRVHIPESELVKIVKDNLKDGLAQLIFPIRIENLDHLLEECKRAERNIAKRSVHRMALGNNRRVYEMEVNVSETEDEQIQMVEALQREKNLSKQLTCWNCKAPGHSFIECPVVQRGLFCYKCGFEDVTSPTCPRCKGNLHQNTRKTGVACSTNNDSQ